ncbi:hypothetical protein [Streptomyces purpureus]|uniref:Uncharacterized protein n=1 Tax=Streptomyces purpureus TaxID=1951 RepID=A0A918GZ22_9ACTN|nr:hypothetical protein [Streptomyces purpureus]GGT20481.1 hypothetical protein GCM10014713_11590 [Streptomyces purpureus]
MAAHAAIPARQRGRRSRPVRDVRRHGSLGWSIPLTLAVIYGFYTSFLQRSGGPITWGQVGFGFLCAAILGGLCYLLGRTQHLLPRGWRATAYGVLAGSAIGFLAGLADRSILTASSYGAIIAAGVFCAAFYVFYTRE